MPIRPRRFEGCETRVGLSAPSIVKQRYALTANFMQ
jgi:hypothetical protein